MPVSKLLVERKILAAFETYLSEEITVQGTERVVVHCIVHDATTAGQFTLEGTCLPDSLLDKGNADDYWWSDATNSTYVKSAGAAGDALIVDNTSYTRVRVRYVAGAASDISIAVCAV